MNRFFIAVVVFSIALIMLSCAHKTGDDCKTLDAEFNIIERKIYIEGSVVKVFINNKARFEQSYKKEQSDFKDIRIYNWIPLDYDNFLKDARQNITEYSKTNGLTVEKLIIEKQKSNESSIVIRFKKEPLIIPELVVHRYMFTLIFKEHDLNKLESWVKNYNRKTRFLLYVKAIKIKHGKAVLHGEMFTYDAHKKIEFKFDPFTLSDFTKKTKMKLKKCKNRFEKIKKQIARLNLQSEKIQDSGKELARFYLLDYRRRFFLSITHKIEKILYTDLLK